MKRCQVAKLEKDGYAIKTIIKKLRLEDSTLKPQSYLDSVREKIGDLTVLKIQTQKDKTDLNRIKKELVKSITIADELKQYQDNNGFTVVVPEYCHSPIISTGDYKAVLVASDWHCGYVIDDCKGNYYNFEIANQRVDKLILETYKYIELFNVKEITVLGLGDLIEHISMRKNQSQFCEFNQAEQINSVIKLMYRLLVAMCKYCNVTYDSIYGNHCRSNGEYGENIDGDNSEVIIREQITRYKELSNNNRLTVVQRRHTDKEIITNINGINIKAIHGDKGIKDAKQQLKNSISVDNTIYDLYIRGHYHNFSVDSENNGRYFISCGCLSGYNDYSVNFGSSTFASQTLIIIGKDKVELIKDIVLQ